MSRNVESFPEITKEELDKLNLTQEAQQFYSQPGGKMCIKVY